MIEAPAAYRTDRNALFFASCVAQESERDPFLLPALRRTPKDTLFCSLRCAGPRKRPCFAPCVAQGPERHPFLLPALRRAPRDTPFCSLRCAGLQKRPCFASCVARGLQKRPCFAPCVARGAENHGFSLSSAANSLLNRPPIRRCAFASGRTVYICAPIIKSTDR